MAYEGQTEDGEFIAEVQADNTGTWAGNGLRFDTAKNAEAYVRDLYYRWTAVKWWQVVNRETREVMATNWTGNKPL